MRHTPWSYAAYLCVGFNPASSAVVFRFESGRGEWWLPNSFECELHRMGRGLLPPSKVAAKLLACGDRVSFLSVVIEREPNERRAQDHHHRKTTFPGQAVLKEVFCQTRLLPAIL